MPYCSILKMWAISFFSDLSSNSQALQVGKVLSLSAPLESDIQDNMRQISYIMAAL
jgi:hypothetical protein